MKLGRVLVLGVAVGAGLVAAVLAMNLVRQSPAPAPQPTETTAEAPPTPPSPQVLVAALDIPIGTTLSEDSVEWRDWPATGVSDKFIQHADGDTDQLATVVGSIARATIYAGEPITEGKLINSDQGYMAAILPAGMRAIATDISVVTSAGGFILPNDRVDVIMVRPNVAGQSVSEVILSNIRVLAIDQTIEDQGGERVVVGNTATLELTPRQAQILAAAQPLAQQLLLSLRSVADSNPNPADAEEDAVYLIDGSKRDGEVTVIRAGSPKNVDATR